MLKEISGITFWERQEEDTLSNGDMVLSIVLSFGLVLLMWLPFLLVE